MKDEITEIKFIEYNGIEGYIELMKHDVEPLNNPDCKKIELYYDGKDIKAVLDYITNLQEENRQTKLLKERYQLEKEDYKSRNEKAIEYINTHYLNANEPELLNILQGEDKDE